MCWNEVLSPITLSMNFVTDNISLAKAELYLTLATIFRRYDNQELFETTRMDVDLKHDMFMPTVDLKSKGVSVLFK